MKLRMETVWESLQLKVKITGEIWDSKAILCIFRRNS